MRTGWIMLLACVLAACAGDKAAPADSAPGRGWIISLLATDPKANFYANYELGRDNVLTYNAGKDSHIAWRGRLTDDEAGAVIGLVDANRETARAESPSRDEPGRRYTLRSTPPGAWVSTTLESGPTPYLDGLYELLVGTQMDHRKDVFEPAVVKPVK